MRESLALDSTLESTGRGGLVAGNRESYCRKAAASFRACRQKELEVRELWVDCVICKVAGRAR